MADLPPGGTRPIAGAATATAVFIGHIEAAAPRQIRSWEEFGEDAGGSDSYLADAVHGWFENGGGACWVAGTGSEGLLAGYEDALACLDTEVTIVVTPDLWEAQDDGAVIAKTVARHCADVQTRVALLHTSQEAAPAEVPELLGLDEKEAQFTAIYYPWLHVVGGDGKKVPPSGHVAGTWARVDSERGVHKTPANEGIRGAKDLTHRLDDHEHGLLSDAGVNCLRVLNGEGIRVGGARTLARDQDWKYLNVRRLAGYLQASITQGTRWAVFEPNDEKLRASVRVSVASFLTSLWRRGALVGRSPDVAFHVICDDSNNTAEGTLVIDVLFAPARPAEFNKIRITQQIADQ